MRNPRFAQTSTIIQKFGRAGGMTKFFIPDFKTLTYCLNHSSGRYEKQPELVPFAKLPLDLKVEKTRENVIKENGASYIITGRVKNKKRQFFTGLISINTGNWFWGNDSEIIQGEKKLSLVVFRFSPDFAKLHVYYFNHFYKVDRTTRIQFVEEFAAAIS